MYKPSFPIIPSPAYTLLSSQFLLQAQPDEEECKEQPPPLARSSSSSPASQQQEPDKEQQAAQRLEEEGLPRLVSVMWKMAAWDIMVRVPCCVYAYIGCACIWVIPLFLPTPSWKARSHIRIYTYTHM